MLDPFGTLGQPGPDSLLAGYLGSAAYSGPEPSVRSPYRNAAVNYADPQGDEGPIRGRSSDLLQLDSDPFGTATARWAQGAGVDLSGGSVMSLDVFGRRMSRDSLMQSDSGRRLVELAERRRNGQRRGFLDAITDFSWEDLPFVSLFATVGKSVSDAVTVSDTFKKLQNGLPVTDDELVKTRLYLAENEERENGTWGATVGNIMRAAPGFMAEFFATGGAYSLARAGLTKLGKEGIHLGMTRATKILTREAMQEAAEKQVAKLGAKGAEGFAKLGADATVRKGMVDEVANTVLKHTMKGNPMYKGLADEALERMAKSRAEHEFSKMLARNAGGKVANGLNTFSQWLGQNVSRGLMDFGSWGTEESTVLFTARSKATRALADAVGTFLVDAPIKGAMMWAPNQFVARPLLGMALGKDGRTVSGAQLGLESAAYMTGDRELMANAEAMSHGLSLLEYVSENTGRGLTSLVRAAGIGLENAGIRGIARPATRALGIAEDMTDAVSLGGKFRDWVAKTFGSREGYRKGTTAAKVAAVARKLGVAETDSAGMRSVEAAVLTGSSGGLRADLAEKVGPDVGKFAAAALKEMSDEERAKLGYRTFGKFMVADWMARHQVGPETVMNMFDRMGYDGVLGEMFEERYSDFAKGLFGWDDRADHDILSNLKTAIKNLYPGWDQLTAEAVAFAMPMVMRAGIMRAQAAVAGGDGELQEVRSNLSAISDAFRIGTVASMSPGEYLATHARLMEQDEAEVARLEKEKGRVQGGIDGAVQVAVDRRLAEPSARSAVRKAGAGAARKSLEESRAAGLAEEEAAARAEEARRSAEDEARRRVEAEARDAARERLTKPGGAAEAVSQIDADIARARKVMERRKEVHEAFVASVPEAAMAAAEDIAVPMYTADDLADDQRYNRAPLLTAKQANEALAGRVAMVDYSPRLGRRLVELESRLEGEDASWWRRAAHRLVGVAGALATGDFSLAAANPAQWTARDMGLSQHVVDLLKKNMRQSVTDAENRLADDRKKNLEEAARLRGEADRAAQAGNAELAADLSSRAGSVNLNRPSREEIMDLAEKISAPAARRIMASNLSVMHLRSFTKEQALDRAMGIVARELGYEWYADKDDGKLRFYRYREGGKEVDAGSVLDAPAFYEANRGKVDATKRDLVSATVDVLTRRLTRAGDESVRLLNAVSLPDDAEIREMLQRRLPGQTGPVSSDAVMREAALYDAAARMVGEGDLVERVRIDGSMPLSETLDRGAFGQVNMATVDYLAGFDKPEDADQRAFDALAWSLRLPFDGTEGGLAKRNGELFALAKIATHFSRDDKAYYSRPTAIDDEDASHLTPNGNVPATATLRDGVWHVDVYHDLAHAPESRVYATKAEMDDALAKEGYAPDKSRLMLTLSRAIESADMFVMLRELGLAPLYRRSLSDSNLHPMLRKNADGTYLSDVPTDDGPSEAERLLRTELALAEGGEHAPEKSREREAWEKVWGENGYMRVGERILEDNGVSKSTVSKYAGEFSDYAPPVYTLSLSAGRLSPTSANVYVPVDPLVSPDLVSGAVNGLLIHAFMTHPRLMRMSLAGTISEFAAQVNSVIDAHAHATKDKTLKAALESFRRVAVGEIYRSVRGPDGLLRVERGAGMTASGFAILANAFVLGRENDYKANPHLRACAEIASDVRMLPAFTDFCDLVDVALGGNGPISSAARMATGAEEAPESQRGLQHLMTYASYGDPKAMERKLREMRPLGLDPLRFLDLCSRRLAAMVKSGTASPVPETEEQKLKEEAASAEAAPAPKAHMTFYGHLMAVVKRALGTDRPVDSAVRDFLADLAEDAQNEPGVTESQREGLRKMLGILRRTRIVGAVAERYAAAFDETVDAKARYAALRGHIKAMQADLRRAKARGEDVANPNVWARREENLAELKNLRKRLFEQYSKARSDLEAAAEEVRASERGGESLDPLTWSALGFDVNSGEWRLKDQEEIDRELDEEARKRGQEDEVALDSNALAAIAGSVSGQVGSVDEAEDEDEDEDEDLAVGRGDAVELPEAVALGEDKTVMSYGFTEAPVEMDVRTRRLCVNVCVRAIAMRAAMAPSADPLAETVTEGAVVAAAKEIFHLKDKEAEALRLEYRLADDLRLRANRTWDDFAVSGARWDFGEDDKADDDVSSDYFVNQAAREYNSPLLRDALALAARVAPESEGNLRAFVARTKEWLRGSVERIVVPGVTAEIGGVPVVWEEGSEGHKSAAWYDPKDKSIHVYAKGVREKYLSGAWLSPERSSSIPRAKELIRSADDLVAWAAYHELGHARDRSPRVADEAGMRAREDRANAFASRHLARAKRQAAMDFMSSVLDPRLDPRGKTQAEQSALHMRALAVFDESPETVAAHVAAMLSDDGNGFPVSRRCAFLLAYMASLQTEDRRNFALLCANSVSAEACRAESGYVDGNRVLRIGPRRVGAGDKVSDRIVGDTFVHVLAGKDAAFAKDCADRLRQAQADVLAQYPKGGAAVAGEIIARVFGRESPLVTALASKAAARHRAAAAEKAEKAKRKKRERGEKDVNTVYAEMADSVANKDGHVDIVESIVGTLETLAAKGEPLTDANVTSAFVRTFETGRPDKNVGVRKLASGPTITDPLKSWLSTYSDSLPATILSADIDQRRESSGSSVPIAPRDSVPMVSRWIYSNEKMKGSIDGKVVEFMTFDELVRTAFPGKTEAEYARCRQDACWPDGSPVCAKNTSSSLTSRELYLACEQAYKDHMDNPNDGQEAWYIPLYAGDHSSSTMLRIPWSVKMDALMKVGQSQQVQLNDVPATDDPGRFAGVAESVATIESEKTILSNEELAYWNEKGVGSFPRILTASEHTDPAFHVKEILDIINGKTTVKDKNGKDTGLTGHDFAGLYLVTKHDGLPMKELLEAKIPKLIHFSVTTLGGTKYEPGVMKYGDLLDCIAEYLKMGLDPAAVTVRIDPIVPGVTKPSDIREVIRRCAEMGIKRVRFSVMDMYASTAKHMAALGYDFAANGYRKVDSKTGMDLTGRTFHADPVRLRGIAERVKAIADEYGITLGTCAEPLVVPGISREGCLSPAAVSNMLGTKVAESKSQQRALCGCFGGKTDALAWNRKCASHCVYCYARHDNEAAMRYYDKDGKLLDNAFTRTRGTSQAPVEQGSAPSAPLGYREAAKLMSYAVGMNLMYTDTKRSAVTSLESQGAGLIGAEEQPDGTVKYGEHRVHILHNWAFERKGYRFEKSDKNAALLGTTRMYGYGARTMKSLAKMRESDLLKLHLISTSGHDLFFIKSLIAAMADDEEFLGRSLNAVLDAYAKKFRGDDRDSTDTYTDDDSYKIGVGNSKAILVEDPATGERKKLMAWLFSRLRDVCDVPKDAPEEDVSKAFKDSYGKLTGDKLDELVGDIPIVDLARTDGKTPVPMKLSQLMPGAMVNFVEDLDGPCLDLSYREDGAMAYSVANVSHSSKVSSETGRVARNYEMDLIAAATMLGDGTNLDDGTVQRAFDLVSNWGIVSACVYASLPQVEAARAGSSAVENLRSNGEHPDGQNIRSEIAKAVWAQVRENANLPVKGVDAALVACGASVDDDNKLFAHTKSPMLRAFMRGAELFTKDERTFFGKKFRHALCNVNMSTPGFRYSWFLDRDAYDSLDPANKGKTEQDVVLDLARMFSGAKRLAEMARDAQGDAKKEAYARLLAAKKNIASLFVDHHGLPIWDRDVSKCAYTEKQVGQFSLADLFDADGKTFDLTAFQFGQDSVINDATKKQHILLGGTRFGFPRTPSYNAHYEKVWACGRGGSADAGQGPAGQVHRARERAGRASRAAGVRGMAGGGVEEPGDRERGARAGRRGAGWRVLPRVGQGEAVRVQRVRAHDVHGERLRPGARHGRRDRPHVRAGKGPPEVPWRDRVPASVHEACADRQRVERHNGERAGTHTETRRPGDRAAA